MQVERRLIFLMDLLQDVGVLRPLILLAARRIAAPIDILVAWTFRERDARGEWFAALEELSRDSGATLQPYASELDAWRLLSGQAGMLVTASESELGTHRVNHAVFRTAPAALLRVTVQHGYECVGFRHNRAHDEAHGSQVGFAADVLCGWAPAASLPALASSERSKLVVTGPPQVLGPRPAGQAAGGAAGGAGVLVCENLHSVRLRSHPGLQGHFLEAFLGFCEAMQAQGRKVTLRPHPAGRFMARAGITLPANVTLDHRPAHAVDFGAYDCGISAPSSVLMDLALAGTPVAVWQDPEGVIDIGNYAGLPIVSDASEWVDFADRERGSAVAGCRHFLHAAGLVIGPDDVEQRFTALFASVLPRRAGGVGRPMRLMFVANGQLPTLDLYFTLPLAEPAGRGDVAWKLLTEADAGNWRVFQRRLDEWAPDILIFCRYSGPHAVALLRHARASGIPCILHLDDDMLNVPRELGEAKFNHHNHPDRLAAIRGLLEHSDLVLCSTPVLRAQLEAGFDTPMQSCPIAVGMDVRRPATPRAVRRVGYMGFDHALDFGLVLPAMQRYLRQHSTVTLELFGRIPPGPLLEEFGARVVVLPPVQGYAAFQEAFTARHWDIGICPLLDTGFNARKSNLKWLEYTAIGAAVVASAGTVYDACAQGGCALLCHDEDSWFQALDHLTRDPLARFTMVRRAQARLAADYSLDAMRAQVLGVLHATLQAHRATSPSTA